MKGCGFKNIRIRVDGALAFPQMIPLVVGDYLTIRPVTRKGYGSIAHEAKPNGLLTRGP